MTEPAIGGRLEHTGRNLDEKLAEMERRIRVAKERLDLETVFASPWNRAGLAVAVGFAVGYSRNSVVLRTGVRLLLTAGIRYLLRDAFEWPSQPAAGSVH